MATINEIIKGRPDEKYLISLLALIDEDRKDLSNFIIVDDYLEILFGSNIGESDVQRLNDESIKGTYDDYKELCEYFTKLYNLSAKINQLRRVLTQ